MRPNPARRPLRAGLAVAGAVAVITTAGCAGNPADAPPPTIETATAAVSPPATGIPAGTVVSAAGPARAALMVGSTLAVLGATADGSPALTLLTAGSATARTVPLPAAATAMTSGDGRLYLSTRGGYFGFDVARPADAPALVTVDGQQDTDFTAIARRADGRLVLGSATGAVYTLNPDATVGATLTGFAHVDAIVTQGDTAVVLDRAQTSVTALNLAGDAVEQALRAGEGATTIAADSVGRVLVADTRGNGLLVFTTDPLILRQRYPVPDAPYGLAGSRGLAWVSQTAGNTVIGYDLATGIPVEKVRYRTVQQPNSLAFDDSTGTLYVASGSGAGVQVIPDAAAGR